MALYLRLSTASQEIPLGYFLDSTDGDAEEVGLTIANTDILVWKTGATTLAAKTSGGATHISNGIYYAVLDATDTDTLGSLVIFCHVAGGLATKTECVVLPANVYDSMILGTDVLNADVTQWLGTAAAAPTIAGVPEVDVTHWIGTAAATPTAAGVPEVDVTYIAGSATAATNLSASALAIVASSALTGTLSTTQMTTNLTEATDDHYNGRIIIWTSGVLLGQATDITDYTGATKLLAYTAVTEAPANADTFVIL